MPRRAHAASCLGFGGDHSQLLITGGLDSMDEVLSDSWILDLQAGRWRKVRNQSVPVWYIECPSLNLVVTEIMVAMIGTTLHKGDGSAQATLLSGGVL